MTTSIVPGKDRCLNGLDNLDVVGLCSVRWRWVSIGDEDYPASAWMSAGHWNEAFGGGDSRAWAGGTACLPSAPPLEDLASAWIQGVVKYRTP